MSETSHDAWAVLSRQSAKCIDGPGARLLGRFDPRNPEPPAHVAGLRTMLFETRDEARAWIRERYGYLRKRPDLRAWPHGRLSPQAVKVRVTVEREPV